MCIRDSDYTKQRMHKNSLNEKVNVYLVDYRDVKNKYDGIVSIEMIEAVGKEYLPSYFNTIKNNLVPGGKVGIQAITIDDKYFDRYKKKQDFIQKYIFPGGFLPSKGSLYSYANQYNLDINSYESFGLHYSETLRLWKDEFFKKWDGETSVMAGTNMSTAGVQSFIGYFKNSTRNS